MWSALRIATSGALAQQRALDVASDNLTKLQVPGSKSQRANFLEIAPDLRYFGVEDGQGNVTLEAREVGKGVQMGSGLYDLTPGSFLATQSDLDVAIDGDGYLEVILADGSAAYTRTGTLQIDGEGRLQTTSGALLSPGITIPPEASGFKIETDGAVYALVEGERVEVGRLQLARFANPEGLSVLGGNLLVPTAASGAALAGVPGEPGVGTVVQGMLESSNIDPREEYLRVIQAQRAYELNVRALRTVDEMLQDATNLRKS
jgi:flagellar basal-body rod protein FlgG